MCVFRLNAAFTSPQTPPRACVRIRLTRDGPLSIRAAASARYERTRTHIEGLCSSYVYIYTCVCVCVCVCVCACAYY